MWSVHFEDFDARLWQFPPDEWKLTSLGKDYIEVCTKTASKYAFDDIGLPFPSKCGLAMKEASDGGGQKVPKEHLAGMLGSSTGIGWATNWDRICSRS